MPLRQLPADRAGNPKPQAQRNFTDPDSHILKGADGWIQGYDTQAAVDGDHQVIVAIGVSNQASDAVHLLPMLKRIEANTGQLPDALIADAGYCSSANLEACEEKGLRGLHLHQPAAARATAPSIPGPGTPGPGCPGPHGPQAPLQGRPGDLRLAQNHRGTSVRSIKGARGLDRYRLRGLEKVNGEWALMATTHNLLKLFRASMATA